MVLAPRALSLALAIALLAVPLAGCMEKGPEAPVLSAEDEAAAEAEAQSAIEAAEKANMTDDGSMAGNASLGSKPHLHDYWDGKERVTLMDEVVTPNEFESLFFTFFQVFGRHNPGAGGAFVTLPDGMIVYEGTGQLELTATWEDPKVTSLAVAYRTAAGPDFTDFIPLTTGTPLVVEVTPEMSDMPHMATSKWMFFFGPNGPGAALGPFNLKIDIVKMRDIEAFPGHPEHFAGAHEKVILDADATTSQQNFASRFAAIATEGAAMQEEAGVAPTEVVPMETREIRVDVTIASATASLGQVSNVWLVYRTASSFGWNGAELIEGDFASGKLVFAIPVEMQEADSPYATESQWLFDLRVGSDPTGGAVGEGFNCGGCADAQVSYHILATAFDSPVLLGEQLDEEDGEGDSASPAAPAKPVAAVPRLS